MSVLTESPALRPAETPVRRGGLRPQATRGNYALGLLIALSIHASLALFWPRSRGPDQMPQFDVEAGDASVEVTLVAALPAEEDAPKEPPPEPTPELPPPPEKAPGDDHPRAPTRAPVPKREPAPQPPKAKPRAAPRAVGDGSSKIPGNDAATARAASGAISSKPAYLRNPHPSYPEEARVARQQGVVTLRVSVEATGHVVAVRVTQSSGFPILDERARSTVADKWVFKPAMSGGVAVACEIAIPVRFTLEH